MRETVTIKINWNSEMSIILAEKAKLKLENAGIVFYLSAG